MRRTTRPRYRDLTALAGWLFADLLLGLMILFLIAAPGAASRALICLLTPTTTATSQSSAAPQHLMKLSFVEEHGMFIISKTLVAAVSQTHPKARFVPAFQCPTPTPTLPPTPTPTPDKNALSKTPLNFTFSTNADALLDGDPSETARLQTLIQQEITPKVSPDDQAGFVLSFGTSPDPTEGETLAVDFDKILKSTLPNLFSRATFGEYHNIGPDRGEILLNVYLFVVGGNIST